jgi:hypothetical protein
MRTFFRSHWKVIVAIALLVLLATVTLNTSSAIRDPSSVALTARLRAHVVAIASEQHDSATPEQLEQAAVYIEQTLGSEGYRIRRQDYKAGGQKVRNIEVSVANVAPGARPARIFIIGAHYDSVAGTPVAGTPVAGTPAPGAPGANDNGSGTAAVLELARLLKTMRPSQGTEVKFVFFVNEEPPWFMGEEMGSVQHARQLHAEGHQVEGALIRYPDTGRPDAGRPDAGRPDAGNFIAFVGTMASSRLVQEALSAFQSASGFPAHGLAAPAYVQGVTLSDHASYNRFGYPAIMIMDTAFMRYPYYHTAEDTPDKLDYDSVARVVTGLARTITALAAGAQS